MRFDSLADLRTFALVIEWRSFSKAARVLGLSPNGVSRRIQRLERQLGVRLLVRTTHEVTPTAEGAAFHERCVRALAELEEAEGELGRGTRQARGSVRVAIPAAALGPGSLEHLRRALAEHPGLHVQLIASHQPVDFVRERLDVAIRPGRPRASTLTVRKLARFAWQLAASPAYLEARGRPRTPEDLAKHECLRFLGERPQREWRLVHRSGEVVVAPVGGRFECDDSRVLGDAVYAGLGIGVRPGRELRAAVAAGRLEAVLPDYTFGEGNEPYALVAPGRLRTRRVEVVLEALGRVLADMGG